MMTLSMIFSTITKKPLCSFCFTNAVNAVVGSSLIFVQVSATLCDNGTQVIGTDSAYMKAPFEILIDKDKVKGCDLSTIDHFATQISTS
jgi:hypothetical protein